MHDQSENLHLNHIIVDDKFESSEERSNIRSLKEAASVKAVSKI